ncbi:hypothetical protein THAOC_22757, partial [Thalassiosira oceanica]
MLAPRRRAGGVKDTAHRTAAAAAATKASLRLPPRILSCS